MSQHNLYVGNELIITRTFKAPKSLVFKAWSEADRLKEWWGPKGFTTDVVNFAFVLNGIFHYSIQSPDGLKMWGKFVYKETEPITKIAFLNSFTDENANNIRAPFSETWPLEMYNLLTLEESNGNTTIKLQISPYNASEAEVKTFGENHENMELGFQGTFDRLEDYLLKN
nr:SRPBCC domain-containing protein [uncultured Flavobacterium sp.]